MASYRILVPTDFSPTSKKAFEVASKVAHLFEGTIKPFHVDVPVTEIDEPFAAHLRYDFEEMRKKSVQTLQDFVKDLVPEQVLEEADTVYGNPAQSIVEVAKGMDLIIMSTHGRTGFSRMLMGSVTEKVLRLSKTPVLAVEDESEVDNFSRILVTTDFSDNSHTAFPVAVEWAKRSNAHVELLHVLALDTLERNETDIDLVDLREKRLQLLKGEYFSEIKDQVTTKVLISDGSAHQAIVAHITESDPHLVIMSTVGRTGLNYLVLGSTTASVVRHTRQAVLSIHPK